MSISILEVIEAGGYDLSTYEDAVWLLAQQEQLGELMEQATEIVEEYEEVKNAKEIAEMERLAQDD